MTEDGTGRRRSIVRFAWYLSAALASAIFLLSLPDYFGLSGSTFFNDVYPVSGATNLAIRLISLLAVLLTIVLAAIVFFKRPDDGLALFVSFFLLWYGVISIGPAEALLLRYLGSVQLGTYVITWFQVPYFALYYLFPGGRFVPRWSRWLLLAAVVLLAISPLSPAYYSFYFEEQLVVRAADVPVLVITVIVWGAVVGAALYGQIHRYRHISTPVQRQQTKWFLYGVVLNLFSSTLSGIPYVYSRTLPPGEPLPPWASLMTLIYMLQLTILPVTLTIAILRYRLWDIDLIVRRTLVYGLVTGTLALIYYGSVLFLQGTIRALTGSTSPLAIVVSTLAIAALFAPLRRRLQDLIDRRFYRRKYDAARALAAVSETLRDEVELDRLSAALVGVVEETMQPETVTIWLRPLRAPK